MRDCVVKFVANMVDAQPAFLDYCVRWRSAFGDARVVDRFAWTTTAPRRSTSVRVAVEAAFAYANLILGELTLSARICWCLILLRSTALRIAAM